MNRPFSVIASTVYILPEIESKEQRNDEMIFRLNDFEKDKEDCKKFLESIMLNCVLVIDVPIFLRRLQAIFSGSGIQLVPTLSIAAIVTIANYRLLKLNQSTSYASYLIDINRRVMNLPYVASISGA